MYATRCGTLATSLLKFEAFESDYGCGPDPPPFRFFP
jgi:hypothetical protein